MSNKDTEMARSGFGEFTGDLWEGLFTRKQAEIATRKCEIYNFMAVLGGTVSQNRRPEWAALQSRNQRKSEAKEDGHPACLANKLLSEPEASLLTFL